ncbi:MAG: DUF2156 domain-containing protein, partial [Lysobacteraceae bacterium]
MFDRDALLRFTEDYLKNLVSDASDTIEKDFDSNTPFGELGVNSFYVLKILKRLEQDFGTLPKSLLFENFNVADLAGYFVDKHRNTVVEKLGGGRSFGSSATTQTTERSADVAQHEIRTNATRAPIRIPEQRLSQNSELQALVDALSKQYNAEGTVSRGTRIIAPNLFIGSERLGYFNYARHRDIVLVYGYGGPASYLHALAEEIHRDCDRRGLQSYFLYDQAMPALAGVPYTATPFGAIQRITNLGSFTLEGGSMRRLRYLVSKFGKHANARTAEYRCGSEQSIDLAIIEIIDRWCAARTMVNPLVHMVREEIGAGRLKAGHRLFLTWLDDELQNVILITEMSGEHSGYLMDLEFYPPEMPLGGLEFAIVHMIDVLAAEGCEILSLGGTYGCKIASHADADPALDKMLDELREQGIFNDEGNLQFKNKFRPESRSIFLCRRADCQRTDDLLDIIMMIADPTKNVADDSSEDASWVRSDGSLHATPTSPRLTDATAKLSQNSTPDAGESGRSHALASAGYNPLAIPCRDVDYDLKTDSWAQLEMPAIDVQIKALHAQLQQPVDVDEAVRGVFPFAHVLLTESGQAAEKIFFGAFGRKGIVLQNLLFPSTLFYQIESGFEPREFAQPGTYDPSCDAPYKGDPDWQAIKDTVARAPDSVAMVCIEVCDNAAGGCAVSPSRLHDLKRFLSNYGVPLVIDATRIVENARRAIELEASLRDKSVWTVVRETLSCADVVIASLTKDFCVRRGGIIATNDADSYRAMRALLDTVGGVLDPIDRRLLALSLRQRAQIESRISRRMDAAESLWRSLREHGVPVAEPAGAHCVLIDVGRIPEFQSLNEPIVSFLAWLYLSTGIRAAAHNAGMRSGTRLSMMVRLAIPVGLARQDVEDLAARLIAAFSDVRDIPDLVLESTVIGVDPAARRYRLNLWHKQSNRGASVARAMGEPASNDAETASTIKIVHKPDQAGMIEKGFSDLATQYPSKPRRPKEVAVIGMAGRYPKARTVAELWDNLVQGRDCIEELPDERWSKRLEYAPVERYRGGFIDGVDSFDSLFFNISPREAEMMDPQERIFLEVAWESLEDAGYHPDALAREEAGRNIGVYVGAVWAMYQMLGVEERVAGQDLTPNSFLWSIANRVSYAMNLSGPSLSVDTACSSSLTAMYLACEAINAGECSAAIVGGVNLDLHQSKYDINHFGGALSPDGVCRSFGKNANGYVAGEGAGALLLKPLDASIQDGDHIYGVIKSAVVNHGGRTSGYTVPNPKAQGQLITAALEKAGVSAATLGYIEAHGTGTELGDPIEISGLQAAFDAYNVANGACAIGSIKSNIGHLEAAAGVVGVSKVLLQMKHRQLVPSLHSAETNEFIDFAQTPFAVQQTLSDWRPAQDEGMDCPLRAGVSSFGAGGANAHIIIEEYRAQTRPPFEICERIFPLSARNDEQLREQALRLAAFLEREQVELADIAHTLQVGRKSFEHRLAIVAKNRHELIDRLRAFASGEKQGQFVAGNAKGGDGMTRLLNRREKEEFIGMLAKSREAVRLAEIWVEGMFSDWQGLRQESMARKTPLPTYPFANRRHWVGGKQPMRKPSVAVVGLHPMIDSNESTFQRQVFRKRFTGRDFFIYDHHVADIPTLPGVAYLEFARKAGELAAGRKVRRIRNILWVSPIAVQEGAPKDVLIELKPSGDTIQFEVYSEHEGSKILHSQGKLVYETRKEAAAEEEYIDIAAIRDRCAKVLDGPQAYPLFKSLGLNLGQSFQVLQEVWKSDEETLGALHLPDARSDDLESMPLHPSLVDGSLQAGVSAQLTSQGGEMFVPFSIAEVEIVHALVPDCYSYVVEAKDDRKEGSQVLKSNVFIVDSNGKVLVKIKESTGVPLRDVHKKAVADDDGFSRLYYTYDWQIAVPP